MAQFKQEVAHLEKTLMRASQNLQAHNMTRKELSRRGDLMSQLTDTVEGLQESVRSGARRAVQNSHSQGNGASTAWRDRGSNSKAGRRDLSGVSEQDVLLCADDEIREQDEALDYLSGTVANLKSIGGDISQEIDLHC